MAAASSVGLPAADTRRGRGRAPSRSRREIAAAGIALADRDGLPATTMRAVAGALGTGASSLYRYVSTRDELVDLMVEEVNGEFDLRASPQGAWVDDMVDLAQQARAIYSRHPWMLEVLEAHPALGPNGYAYLDHALALLGPAGGDGRTRLEAVGVFSGLVRMLCKQEHAQGVAARAVVSPIDGDAFTRSYPHVAAALADTGPLDAQFERILRRVITGLLVVSPDDL